MKEKRFFTPEPLFDKLEYLVEQHVLVTQDSSKWATTIVLVLMASVPESNTNILVVFNDLIF